MSLRELSLPRYRLSPLWSLAVAGPPPSVRQWRDATDDSPPRTLSPTPLCFRWPLWLLSMLGARAGAVLLLPGVITPCLSPGSAALTCVTIYGHCGRRARMSAGIVIRYSHCRGQLRRRINDLITVVCRRRRDDLCRLPAAADLAGAVRELGWTAHGCGLDRTGAASGAAVQRIN